MRGVGIVGRSGILIFARGSGGVRVIGAGGSGRNDVVAGRGGIGRRVVVVGRGCGTVVSAIGISGIVILGMGCGRDDGEERKRAKEHRREGMHGGGRVAGRRPRREERGDSQERKNELGLRTRGVG
jgi:hypothetical protein